MSPICSTTKNRGFKHDKEICWKHEPIDFENTELVLQNWSGDTISHRVKKEQNGPKGNRYADWKLGGSTWNLMKLSWYGRDILHPPSCTSPPSHRLAQQT